MNNEALWAWAKAYPYSPGHQAVLRVLAEIVLKDDTIKAQAERIAAQSDALSRVVERGAQSDLTVSDSDWSRRPEPPRGPVIMPAPLVPMEGGDPAPTSLATDDANLRKLEDSERVAVPEGAD